MQAVAKAREDKSGAAPAVADVAADEGQAAEVAAGVAEAENGALREAREKFENERLLDFERRIFDRRARSRGFAAVFRAKRRREEKWRAKREQL